MRLAAVSSLLLSLTVAIPSPGAVQAASGPSSTELAPYLPAGTRGILYFKSPEKLDGLFRGTPVISAERIEKHLGAAFDTFAAATGYDILKQTEWAILTISASEHLDNARPMLFVKGNFDLQKLLPIIEKDPLLAPGRVTRDQVNGRPLYTDRQGMAVAFPTESLLMMGDEPRVRAALDSGGTGKPAFDLDAALVGFDPERHRIYLGLEIGEMVKRVGMVMQNAVISGLASRLQRLILAIGESRASLSVQFSSAVDAKAASDTIGGVKDFVKSYLNVVQQRFENPSPDSSVSAISPQALYSRISAEAATEILTEVTNGQAGDLMTLEVPRDKLRILAEGDGPIAFTLASAAVVLPAALRARQLASRQACYGIQRHLQMAVDTYLQGHPERKGSSLDQLADDLVAEGLINPDIPQGRQGPHSFLEYQITPDVRITCARHGSLPAGSPDELPGMPIGRSGPNQPGRPGPHGAGPGASGPFPPGMPDAAGGMPPFPGAAGRP